MPTEPTEAQSQYNVSPTTSVIHYINLLISITSSYYILVLRHVYKEYHQTDWFELDATEMHYIVARPWSESIASFVNKSDIKKEDMDSINW